MTDIAMKVEGSVEVSKDVTATFIEGRWTNRKVSHLFKVEHVSQAGINSRDITGPKSEIWLVKQVGLPMFNSVKGCHVFVPKKMGAHVVWYDIPVSLLIPGEVIGFSKYPNKTVSLYDDSVKLECFGAETSDKVKHLISLRMSDLNLFGHWDVLTPLTPVALSAVNWTFWKGKNPAPQIYTTRTENVSELEDRGNKILTSLRSCTGSHPAATDAYAMVQWTNDKLGCFSVWGLQRVCGFYNQLAASWQRTQSLDFLSGLLRAYGWEVCNTMTVVEKLSLFIGHNDRKDQGSEFSKGRFYKKETNISRLRKALRIRVLKEQKKLKAPETESGEGPIIMDDGEESEIGSEASDIHGDVVQVIGDNTTKVEQAEDPFFKQPVYGTQKSAANITHKTQKIAKRDVGRIGISSMFERILKVAKSAVIGALDVVPPFPLTKHVWEKEKGGEVGILADLTLAIGGIVVMAPLVGLASAGVKFVEGFKAPKKKEPLHKWFGRRVMDAVTVVFIGIVRTTDVIVGSILIAGKGVKALAVHMLGSLTPKSV